MMPIAAEGVTVLQTVISWGEKKKIRMKSERIFLHKKQTNPKTLPNLCYLLQQLKLLDIVVPFDSQAVWYWFQTLPHVLQTTTDNTFPFVPARGVT